jgi:porin
MGQQHRFVKGGQLAADSEFFNTKYTDVLTNASMGWPAITSVDLPSGGPSPPLAAVGARLLVNVGDNLSALGGIFDGNQAGPGTGDAQQRDRYGINFRVNDPPLVLGQIQYSWNSKKGDPNLAGSFKLGGWRNFGPFSDLRFASNGVSLASPESSGTPAILSGDFGLWAVFEQQLYRVPKSDDRGIGLFGRVSSSATDSSLLDFYADAGIEFIGLSEARSNDKFGVAAGYAHVSRRAQALDADFCALVGSSWPPLHGRLSVRNPRGLDRATKPSVHPASGRRRDRSGRCRSWSPAAQRDGVGNTDYLEILETASPRAGLQPA